LAEALKCAYYHAGDVDRAERLKQWLMDGGLIVATLTLSAGVEFPGIVYIGHMGIHWSMIDYAQESETDDVVREPIQWFWWSMERWSRR
jgi:superfamily II DNA helicase RecQ